MTIPTLLGTSGHGAGSQPYDSASFYSNVGLGRNPMTDAAFTAEVDASQIIRVSGTVSYLSWGLDTAFGVGLTLSLNKNSSSTTLAVSVGGSVTGWVTDSSSAHNVSVSSGDVLDFDANVSSPGNSSYTGSFYCVSARFDANTGSAQILTTVGGTTSYVTPIITEQFIKFVGVLGQDTTEGDQQFKSLTAGTWRNMACYIATNCFDQTTTITNRINFSNGAMAISVSGTVSGYFEDNSSIDHDSVNADDLLNYGFVASAAGNGEYLYLYWIGAHFLATNTELCMIGVSEGISAILTGTKYTSLFGGGETAFGEEVDRAIGLLPFDLSASRFTNHLTNASGPPTQGSATFTLLKNGSSSGLAVTSLPGSSGFFMTGSEAVSFSVGDICTNKIVVTQGNVTWASAALLLEAST